MSDEIEGQGDAAADSERPAPSCVEIGVTAVDVLADIRVVDAETGERIDKVIFADADAGKVRRYAVEDGALVLEQDQFKVIEEDRPIRVEWLGNKRKNSF
ncbi:hypothetical protein NYF14_10585 [Sphingobium sp. 10 DY56-G10]|uniref:hypothetical protein n=1 Tax=Sphingobium sp. 10 DY56-G10 TaxID=2974918 RepID=UPI00352A8528